MCAALEDDGDPDLAHLDDAAVESRVRDGAAVIAASTAEWLDHVRELVVRGIWADQGARTPSQWLSWAVSMGESTAREHIRVALRLVRFPRTRERFAAGELSYTKARAITRLDVPELEEVLLEWAGYATGTQMEQIVRTFTRQNRAVTDEVGSPHDRREYSRRELPDGRVELRLRTSPDDAELVDAQVCRRAEELYRERSGSGTDDAGADAADGDADGARRTPEGRLDASALRADALLELVATAPDVTDDGSGYDRHTLVLHASAEAFVDLPEPGQDRSVPVRLAGGRHTGTRTASMSVRTLHRLACDAGVRWVAEDENGSPVASSDRRRLPTATQRRALIARDRTCRFPGCTTTRWLHAHHIVHCEDGGPTELWNLVMLCRHHHRFVHDHDWRIEHDGRGRFRFHRPGHGPVQPVVPLRPPPGLQPVVAGAPASPRALHTHGDLDLSLDDVVIVLQQQLDKARPPERDVIAA